MLGRAKQRYVIRERTTYDVVDTHVKPTDPAEPHKDGTLVLNTGDRAQAEQWRDEHEALRP